VYAPSPEQVERARRILAVEGVERLDGEMVDEATRKMAEAVLARSSQYDARR
jgi:citrate lyase beta subunit